jgi:2-desacetyl-2-hydroxyethyl bacteriochlorophyllide A dehydrogenase
MKALVWEAPRRMVVREQERPAVSPDEVLIQVAYAGICGSELGGYLGHNALRVPPLVMGHEFSGEVVQLGAQAAERNPGVVEGQRVTVNPLTFCGTCEFCARGLNQLCVHRRLIGAHRPGAFAEYVAVPAEQVIPLPEGLSPRIGAITEPVACGVRVGDLAGPVEGETALVIGAGPMGLLSMQALFLRGAKRVFIADLDPGRLNMGAGLGGAAIDPRTADLVETARDATDGRGVKVSIDAVGTAGTRAQCISATRTTGRVVLCGLHEESSAVPVADVIRRELTLRGSFASSPKDLRTAVQLLAKGAIRLDPWVVEAPLEEGGQWFDRLIDAPGDIAKVLLVP